MDAMSQRFAYYEPLYFAKLGLHSFVLQSLDSMKSGNLASFRKVVELAVLGQYDKDTPFYTPYISFHFTVLA